MAKGTTLRSLATEGLMDFDEALLRVWDSGFDEIEDIDQSLSSSQVGRVRDVLGLPTVQEMRSVDYWLDVLSMDRAAFSEMLDKEIGVTLSPNARKLPKGALSRLKKNWAQQQATHAAVRAERERVGQRGADGNAPRTSPGVEWRVVGRPIDLSFLEVQDVQRIHETLTAEFASSEDPIDPPGVKDPGLLESAVYRCQTSLGDVAKYPTPEMASAALLYGITHDHPFHNGNKRTALVAMLSMLDQNGHVLTCQQGQLFKFMLRFAQHQFSYRSGSPDPDRETLTAAEWICENSRTIERGERPLKWRELKQRLKRFDVEWDTTNVGNRLKLTREVTRKAGWFGRTRKETLQCHTHYADDGREVARNQLNQIRGELQLTEDFGIDSAVFYASDAEIDDFIADYRKILYRLAKL